MKDYLARVNRPVLETYAGVIKKIEELRGEQQITIPYLERDRVELHIEIFRQAGVTGKSPDEEECQIQLDKFLNEARKR